MIAALLVAVAVPQDATPSVPPVAKSVVSIDPAPIAVPLVSAMSPDHQRLAVETRDEGVWILNLTTKTWDLRIKPKDPHTIDIAWSSDGSRVALVGSGGYISIWESSTGLLRSTIEGQQRTSSCRGTRNLVSFAARDEVLVAALGSSDSEMWNLDSGARIAAIRMRSSAPATAFATSKDGRYVAIGNTKGDVGVWNSRTGEQVALPVTLLGAEEHGSQINSLDFDPAGALLAIGAGDCRARLWRFESESTLRELSHCDQDIFGGMAIGCVRFDATGSKLLTTSFTFWEARVWDVATGKVLRHFDFDGGNPVAMPGWFTVDDTAVTLSLGMRTREVVLRASPSVWSGNRPPALDAARASKAADPIWYECDAMHAWAVEDEALVVRNIQDAVPVAIVAIRALRGELPAEAIPAKGAGGK